jgi:hypothetical protein
MASFYEEFHMHHGYECNAVECGRCRHMCDPQHEDMTVMDGEPQCEACREMCDGTCGEFITDESVEDYGPVVQYRDWALDGKLQRSHATCAADVVLTYMVEGFDWDKTTRQEIAAAVRGSHVLVH